MAEAILFIMNAIPRQLGVIPGFSITIIGYLTLLFSISYFVINTLDSSVSGGFSSDQIKDQYDLPDNLELFEPEARRDEFIKNNPDIHEAHERERNKDF